MRFTAVAVMALFAGCLSAQTSQTTETKTTTVDLNGALVDAPCYTTHEQTRSTSPNPNGSITTTESSRLVTECPVTDTSTTIGLLTPDGRFVRFDNAGNTRVIEMVKHDKHWRDYITGHKPVRVHVIGTSNGDVIVLKDIK